MGCVEETDKEAFYAHWKKCYIALHIAKRYTMHTDWQPYMGWVLCILFSIAGVVSLSVRTNNIDFRDYLIVALFSSFALMIIPYTLWSNFSKVRRLQRAHEHFLLYHKDLSGAIEDDLSDKHYGLYLLQHFTVCTCHLDRYVSKSLIAKFECKFEAIKALK